MTVRGDGSMVRDYLYVSDLAEALKLVVGTETQYKTLNVGRGWVTSFEELLAIIAEVTGERPEVEYVPARALDFPENVLDITRAREELGWSATTDLADGIERTWEWIRRWTSVAWRPGGADPLFVGAFTPAAGRGRTLR